MIPYPSTTLKRGTIQDLKDKKEEILVEEPLPEGQMRAEELQEEIRELFSRLPTSLKFDSSATDEFDINGAVRELIRAHRHQKGLRLDAFWDATVEHDLKDLKPGDRVQVYVGDVADRVGALLVSDEDGHAIGVVVNVLPRISINGSYRDFVRAMQASFGPKFPAEIASIRDKPTTERHYFKICLLSSASDVKPR